MAYTDLLGIVAAATVVGSQMLMGVKKLIKGTLT
jgi:hypothetical protein